MIAALALGIEAGVPLRLKGVPVGTVKNVTSSLECVEAVVEVHQK
jgi:ABC-type transporter Mla subunit MlaD